MLDRLKTILSNSRSDPVVEIEGENLPVLIRRSPRSTRLSMRADPVRREIRITMPTYAPTIEALNFVARKKEWIAMRMQSAPASVSVKPGGEIAVAGDPYVIVWDPRWPRRIELVDGELRLGGPEESVEQRILRWLKAQARETFTEDLNEYCARAGAPMQRLSLGDPRSRWGSCSTSGTVSLSWRLFMAPPYVRRSVIAHEVAHIRHMNHSTEFYAWFDEIFEGDRKAADRWLKMHGTGLQRIGR